MKKSVIMTAIILAFVLFMSNVYATLSATVELKPNITNIKPGDKVTVILALKDIAYTNLGVMGIEGTINYNKDIFEDLGENNIKTLNNWEKTYNPENGKIIVEGSSKIEENKDVLEIELTVKSNAQVGSYTNAFGLSNVEVFNTEITQVNDCGINVNIAKDEEQEPTVAVLVGLSIKTPPTKIEYDEGEKFDPTGMVLTAEYSDDTTKDITEGYTWTPVDELSADIKGISISYKEGEVTKTIIQPITVNEDSEVIGITDEEVIPSETDEADETDGTEAEEDIPQTGIAQYAIPTLGIGTIIAILSVALYNKYKMF